MLIIEKHDTYTLYAVDNEKSKISFISNPSYRTLVKFSHYFGGIEYLRIPDENALKQFRKAIKEPKFKLVPMNKTKEYLVDNFPELFI